MTAGGEGRWARRPGRVLASSDRILLTPERRSDWWAMEQALADEELLGWQGWTLGDAALRVLAARRGLRPTYRNLPANMTVRDRLSRAYVGTYSISWTGLDLLTTEAYLGWWLARENRGQGLGTESLRLVLDVLKHRSDLTAVHIGTRHDNERVLRMVAATGATFVEERPTQLPDGSTPMGKWFVVRMDRGPTT